MIPQLERSMIVARLRRGREMKRRIEWLRGRSAAYGYRTDDGSLVAVPEESRAIKLAKKLRKRGLSYREIAAHLEAEGMLPRSGGRWHPPMVSRLVNGKTNG